MNNVRRHLHSVLACMLLALSAAALRAQAPDQEAIDRAHRMLAQIKQDLQRYYYDSTYGGLDLEARVKAADSSLSSAPTVQNMFGVIAQFLFEFNDSHTSFAPPRRAAIVEYGWAWTMVGDACYVSAVVRGSDAEKKGLAVGDRVLAIDGMLPTRQTRWLIGYLYYRLNPRPGMRVSVQKPDGTRQELDILAKVTESVRVEDYTNMWDRNRMYKQSLEALRGVRHRTKSLGDTVLVWRMRSFIGGDEETIDEIMREARQHKALILDLRNNGGGAVATLLRLIGHFFDHDVRVATVRSRDKTEPMTTKPQGRRPFAGNFVILINANSASASELTSRIMQLEGRATIVGDRSAGAVMVSRFYSHAVGFTKVLTYGASITVEDIIMPDEGRLENVGVTPEFIVLPTAADMVARRDPAMAKALALVGVTRDPAEAARIFQDREQSSR